MIQQADYDDPESCAILTHALLKARHDEAALFVIDAIRKITDKYIIDDVVPNEFLSDHGLNKIDEGYKKTPDIMFILDNSLFVGDIAVTQARIDTSVRKSKKYDDLRRMITIANPNIIVEEFNVIFDANLGNLTNIITAMVNTLTTGWSTAAINNFREKIFDYNDQILTIQREVKDSETYLQYRDKLGGNQIIDTFLNDILLNEESVEEEYTPSLSEEELFMDAYYEMKRQEGDSDDSKKDKVTIMREYKNSKNIEEILNKKNDTEFEKRLPKSPLQYVFNLDNVEEYHDLELVEDYVRDIALSYTQDVENRNRMQSILPHMKQVSLMKDISKEFKSRATIYKSETFDGKFSAKMKAKYGQKTPYYSKKESMSYTQPKDDNLLYSFSTKIKRMTKKSMPKSIHSLDFKECIEHTEYLINYLSGTNASNHTSTNLTFDLPAGVRNPREQENIEYVAPIFDRINKSRAAILVSSIVKWINDVVRISIGNKSGIYYSIPIQRSMIFCTITGPSMYGINPHYNYFTIARYKIDEANTKTIIMSKCNKLMSGQIEFYYANENYVYVVSKLNKVNLEKLEKIITIDHEFRTHAMSMAILLKQSVLLDKKVLFNQHLDINNYTNMDDYIDALHKLNIIDLSAEHTDKVFNSYMSKYLGGIALTVMDLHQKPSIILDLLKYISGINFSEISNLTVLLIDKLNIMLKTNLDVYLRYKLLRYCDNNIKNQKYCRPNKIIMTDKGLSNKSFNVTGVFVSFWDEELYTSSLLFYYSEAQLIFQSRPKKLYNDQYMAKAALKVVKNNKIMEEEEKRYPSSTRGIHNSMSFKFNNQFSYSRDAMFYAQDLQNRDQLQFKARHKIKILGKINELAVSNISMRGSCKLEENIRAGEGKSQTSLYSALEFLEPMILTGDNDGAKLLNICKSTKYRTQAFNMSAKEQRGDGRPIGSPDFPTKQQLYLVESIYKIISMEQNENLLVKGVNRSAKIASINRSLVSSAYTRKCRFIRHIVMDQSQFSEGDNTNKFVDNILMNNNIPNKLKLLMMDLERNHSRRHQYWPIMPVDVEINYPNDILPNNCIIGRAGWVQGMKNIISTYVHIVSVKWLLRIFNKYYFKLEENINKYDNNVEILMEQIVNSDDSYCIVACTHLKPIHDFYNFLNVGKKYFRLVQNEKKSYLTATIGEIIQKYVANGTVINIWAKTAVSSFRNNNGVDMCRDVSNSVSQLGNLLREGCPEIMITYLRAELKNQIFRLYNVGPNKFNDLRKLNISQSKLPCELGGWPSDLTTYELANAGLQSQLEYCKNYYKLNPDSNECKIVKTSIMLNFKRNTDPLVRAELTQSYKANNNLTLSTTESNKIINTQSNDDINDINQTKKLALQMDLIDDEYSNYQQELTKKTAEELGVEPELVVETQNELIITNEGLSAYDGSFARSTINSINWIINVPKRVSRTLKKLNQYRDIEGSGLSGLFKERLSIRRAIGDLIEQSNSMVIQLSEQNFTRSLRQKAAANSYAATQRCCTIGGIPKKFSILGAFNALTKLYDKLIPIYNAKMSDQTLYRVLTDPTGRAPITYKVVANYETKTLIESEGYIANEIPKLEDEIELGNDIQSVLIELIKPGYLLEQGYKFRYEERLKSDMATIRSVYSDWFNLGKDDINIIRTIYFHYINIRRSRYIIAPPLKARTIVDYLISVYEKTQYIGLQKVGTIRKSVHRDLNELNREIADKMYKIYNVMGALEVMIYYEKVYNNDMRETGGMIEIDGKPLEEYVKSIEYGILYNLADDYNKRYLALTHYIMTTEIDYLKAIGILMDYNIVWLKEQEKMINPSGETEWYGPFSAVVQKGEHAVKITGMPGNIELIETNTLDYKIIVNLLYYFIKKVPFKGYKKPSNKEQWGNTVFWNSTNSMSELRLVYGRNFTTKIETNTTKDIGSSSESGVALVDVKGTLVLQRMLQIKKDYVSYIPLNYNTRLELSNTTRYSFNKYTILNNGLYGTRSENVVRNRMDRNTGTTYRTEEYTTQNILVFKFKDNHKTSSYSLLRFKMLYVDGIDLNSFNNYDILKNVIRDELLLVPRSLITKFIKTEIPMIKIINYFIKIATSKLGVLNRTEPIESYFKIETIEISMDVENIEIIGNEDNIDIDEQELIDVDDDIGDIIQVKNTSYMNILLELSTARVNMKNARIILKALISSKFMRTLKSIISKEKMIPNDWSNEFSIDSYLNEYIEMPVANIEQKPDKDKNKMMLRKLTTEIINNGLLFDEIWKNKSLVDILDNWEEGRLDTSSDSDNSAENVDIFYENGIREAFNLLEREKFSSSTSSRRDSINSSISDISDISGRPIFI
ncbi:MAG: RNA-dependent RNA polymerase [Sanya sesamia inferens phasmavirus 1]|nr:MAG: RNA-dependent RNA polymerase [Sanya sesamia inferens phasmavirus 1]